MSQPNPAEIQKFARRVSELRREVSTVDPKLLARRTRSQLSDQGDGSLEFRLELWGHGIRVPYPSLEVTSAKNAVPLPMFEQALVLYYFSQADGEPLHGRWISFAELPNGRFYNQAFQGYTGGVLSRHFGIHGERFSRAAEQSGGETYPLGSAAYIFTALPQIPILVVFWQGDEDFPPSFQLLFDEAASHYLPTDGYAILGSAITRRLIKTDKKT